MVTAYAVSTTNFSDLASPRKRRGASADRLVMGLLLHLHELDQVEIVGAAQLWILGKEIGKGLACIHPLLRVGADRLGQPRLLNEAFTVIAMLGEIDRRAERLFEDLLHSFRLGFRERQQQ